MKKLLRLSVSGFTLVELLVVVSIIAILAAVLMANFGDAREAARNKAVQSTLKETQLAIELYRSQNGQYPPVNIAAGSPCVLSLSGGNYARSEACTAVPFISELSPEYIAELPDESDSANDNCSYRYSVASDGSWYKLTAHNCLGGIESAAQGMSVDDELARCPASCPASGTCSPSSADFYQSMAVYSFGGECVTQ